jgi:peptidoglycan/LPS O-acetylase OafA/YrhL
MSRTTYFPGLNAIRFYAALSVVLYHIDLYPNQWFHIAPRFGILNLFFLSGGDSVTIFFVVSGFLITYLLLDEQQKTGKILVRQFYVRRMLRICPLYYLLTIIGLILLPSLFSNLQAPSPIEAALVVFMMPNVARVLFPIPTINHLWSIGVEEQFYLAYPLLMRMQKNLPRLLVAVIVIKWLLLLPTYAAAVLDGSPQWFSLILFLNTTRFECMAVGGLAAYFLHSQSPALKIVFSRWVKVPVLLLIVGIIVVSPDLPFYVGWIYDFAVSIIFAVFIINVVRNPHPLLNLENRILNGLGSVSYGIYMFHPPLLYVIIRLLSGMSDDNTRSLLIYGLTISLTLAAAFLSYRYVEKPFLRLKARFAARLPVTDFALSPPPP